MNRILTLASLSLALLGCTTTRYVEIRHPLQVGAVDPNSVPMEARNRQREAGLPPGTLVDEAHLVEVTPERLCAQVTLWNLESNAERGAYQNYRIALLSDERGVEQTQADVQLLQATITPTPGTIARNEVVGRERVCTRWVEGRCTRRVWRDVYETRYYPHTWQVQRNPAQVCFPNGGFITPATSRAAIEFKMVGNPGRFVFEWQFQSAVANGGS